jgi:hypothetical protein
MDALHRWLRKCSMGTWAILQYQCCGCAAQRRRPHRHCARPPTSLNHLWEASGARPLCLGEHACPLQAGRSQRGPCDFALVWRTPGRHVRLRAVLGAGNWPEGRRVPLRWCAEMTLVSNKCRQRGADVAVLAVFPCLPTSLHALAARETIHSHCSAFHAHTQSTSLNASLAPRRRASAAGRLVIQQPSRACPLAAARLATTASLS